MSINDLDELTDSEIQMYLDGQLKGIRKTDLENRISVESAIRQRIIEYTALDKQFSRQYRQSIFFKHPIDKDKKPLLFFSWQLATSFVIGLVVAISVINFKPMLDDSIYAQEAVAAHFKYSPEQHISGDTKILAFDKSATQNNTFRPPDLMQAGLELVGVRHLRVKEGKSVQLMYHDASGQRYTVLITQNPTQKAPLKPDYYNSQLAQVSYWGNNKYNFAVTGINDGVDVRRLQSLIAQNFL